MQGCKWVLALVGSLVLSSTSAGALKQQPSRDVDLEGTWKIDSARSDDPGQVLQKAAEAAEARRNRSIEERHRTAGGIFNSCRDDGGWDRDTDFPDERMPVPRTHQRPCPNPRGYGRLDPDEGPLARRRAQDDRETLHNEFLLQLDPNPETLTIVDETPRVSIFEEKLETACTAGKVEPFSDVFGDGERRCGWDGRAWVIETKRDKRFKRVDRFEPGKDGQTLLYTSRVSGPRMAAIRVSRVYTRAVSAAP